MPVNKENLRQQFSVLENAADIAALIGVSEKKLEYVLYKLYPKYWTFKIPKKSGGERQISAPNEQLKRVQQSLNIVLQQIYEPRRSVYGFVIGKNIVDNAKNHIKRHYVLNIDLKDFFPSIHFGRVRGMLVSAPYNLPVPVAYILAQLCSEYTGLPQGAPTSPIIANMICSKMDTELQRFAKRHRCFYTRYADDITFSSSGTRVPAGLGIEVDGHFQLSDELLNIILKNGFQINEQKIRLQTPKQRQEVTGLTVNKFVNVQRQYIRQVRVMLHDWKTKGLDNARERHYKLHPTPSKLGHKQARYEDIIRGKIEFIRQVKGEHSSVYQSLATQLAALDPNFGATFIPKNSTIFINYAREDKNEVYKICDMLQVSGFSVWMDVDNLTGGDEWERKIFQAIDNAAVFVACLSELAVHKDGFVQKEIEYALKRHSQMTPRRNFIIPLRLQKCEIQESLRKYDWIDHFEMEGPQKLRKAIQDILN